jgi:hypothetical protein
MTFSLTDPLRNLTLHLSLLAAATGGNAGFVTLKYEGATWHWLVVGLH